MWYTSGDGRDVASGDEYHFGYTVHCRASDPATAERIVRAVNVSEILSFVSRATPEQAETLATLCRFMVECGADPAVFRIDECGVHCEARGKRSLLTGAAG